MRAFRSVVVGAGVGAAVVLAGCVTVNVQRVTPGLIRTTVKWPSRKWISCHDTKTRHETWSTVLMSAALISFSGISRSMN